MFGFLAKISWKIVLVLAIVGALIFGGWTMYRDYADKVDQIVQLTSDNATLDATIAVNEATIASAKKRERQNEIDRQEFDASNARAETKKNQLKEIFQDQDLEMQALADAVEIEQRINDVTYDLFRSIECSTDSLCD